MENIVEVLIKLRTELPYESAAILLARNLKEESQNAKETSICPHDHHRVNNSPEVGTPCVH